MSRLIEFPEVEQRSDEWHDQRRGMVTASAAGMLLTVRAPGAIEYDCPECLYPAGEACVSLSRKERTAIKTSHRGRIRLAEEQAEYATPIVQPANNDTSRALTLVLAAERISGNTDPTFISADMWRGIEDEPRAVEVYAETFAPVMTTGFMVRELDNGHMLGYSPDGLVGDDGLIEVKSRKQKKQLATVLDDKVPAENMAQIQAGLLVSGRAWCDYLSYCGGMHLYPIRVLPDAAWFNAIEEAVEQFEKTAAQMVATYETRTTGLPMTERVVEEEIF